MNRLPLLALTALIAAPALADDTRQLDAHEHGVGQLDIALDGMRIAMELRAPGADIVGFEYAAQSAEDNAKLDAAVAMLAKPLELFVMTDAAGCSVVQARAGLESEYHHDEDAHRDDDHDGDHKDGHDDHHDDHAKGDHDDRDDHADAAGHTEFHAEYLLACADPAAINDITFAYFETFPNAQQLEVQIIAGDGAKALAATRDAPTLDLGGIF